MEASRSEFKVSIHKEGRLRDGLSWGEFWLENRNLQVADT